MNYNRYIPLNTPSDQINRLILMNKTPLSDYYYNDAIRDICNVPTVCKNIFSFSKQEEYNHDDYEDSMPLKTNREHHFLSSIFSTRKYANIVSDDYYQNPLDWSNQLLIIGRDPIPSSSEYFRPSVSNFQYGALIIPDSLKLIYSTEETRKGDYIYTRSKAMCPSTTCTRIFKNNPSLCIIANSVGEWSIFDLNGKIPTPQNNNSSSTFYSYSSPLTTGRISCIDILNESLFMTGSKDGNARLYDLRVKPVNYIYSYSISSSEVCGLDHFNETMIAGTNDNSISKWDIRMKDKKRKRNELNLANCDTQYNAHVAAVKAVCYFTSNLVLSGGGTSDRKLKLWQINTSEFELLDSIDTGSQITNIFKLKLNFIITTHGFTQNEICVWKIKNNRLLLIYKLSNIHENRIVGGAVNHDYIGTISREKLVFSKINIESKNSFDNRVVIAR